MDISVIIPIYNVEEYLKTCLDSVARKVKKDGELYKELAAHARGRGADIAGSSLSANKKKRLKWFCRFPE